MEENMNITVNDNTTAVETNNPTEIITETIKLIEPSVETIEDYFENSLTIIEKDDLVSIYATDEQKKEMFTDWAMYLGEVSNPLKTTANYNKGNYAPLDEVLNTVRPILSKYGFGILQIPTCTADKVSIQTIITHKSGGMIAFPSLDMPVVKPDAQTIIASTTYARRGSLNAMLGIYGENDDDGNAASGNGNKPRKPRETQPKDPAKPPVPQKSPEVEAVCTDIVKIMGEKIEAGIDKDTIYNIISDNNNGKKNPNSITDIETANKIKDLIQNLERETE